jgi:hypothetical protein
MLISICYLLLLILRQNNLLNKGAFIMLTIIYMLFYKYIIVFSLCLV